MNVHNRQVAEELIGFSPSYIDGQVESLRLVMIGNHARPCMGTHVDNVKDIGKIIIRSIKKRKQEIGISYKLQEPE